MKEALKTGDNIVLVGMPGSGKSTIGVLLAERLGYEFLDTDILIQTRKGKSLQLIIEAEGLDGFCRFEEKTILSLSVTSHVISTGGSVVYSKKAMQHLKKHGWVCHLDTAPRLLRSRLDNIDSRGIVMTPGQSIESLYRERYPLYMQHADFTVESGDSTANQVLQKIDSVLAARTGRADD